MVMRILVILLKLICYLALGVVAAGIAALIIVTASGGCPRFDEGAVQCVSPFYESLGYFGLAVLLSSVFTGVPAFLAIGGLVFLIRDFMGWRRWLRSNRAARPRIAG